MSSPTHQKSIIRLAGGLLGSIVVLSLISISASLLTVQSAEGDAKRINQSGSLRMLSMRIAIAYRNHLHLHPASDPTLAPDDPLAIVVAEFEKRLFDPLFSGSDIMENTQQSQKLAQLKERWKTIFHLLITHEPPSMAFDALMVDYVHQIDQFVTLVEQASEAKITRLQWIHSLGLVTILISSLLLLHMLSRRVIKPLHELRKGALQASNGNLGVRIRHQSRDELGDLAQAFNHMATELEQMYQNLGTRVAEKTQELFRRNQALEFLNDAATGFTFTPNSRKTLLNLMKNALRVTGLKRIGFIGFEGNPPSCRLILTAESAGNGIQTRQWPDNLSGATAPSSPNELSLIPEEMAQSAFWLSPGNNQHLKNGEHFPLFDHQRLVAVFFIEPQNDAQILSWQRQLMLTFSDIVNKSFNQVSAQSQKERFLLFEERAVIARELHDSIAQSLSYLKMQVSRFQVLIRKNVDASQLELVASEIRTGLNSAYTQLREVLTTFRIRLNEPGLEQALKSTLVELAGRSETKIAMDYGLTQYQPAVNEEIHILQIIREALTNVVKHAEAEHAWIRLQEHPDGEILIEVRDDGLGLPENYEKAFHHGITIMTERAAMLNGHLRISHNTEIDQTGSKGTCIQVTFRKPAKDEDDLLILPPSGD